MDHFSAHHWQMWSKIQGPGSCRPVTHNNYIRKAKYSTWYHTLHRIVLNLNLEGRSRLLRCRRCRYRTTKAAICSRPFLVTSMYYSILNISPCHSVFVSCSIRSNDHHVSLCNFFQKRYQLHSTKHTRSLWTICQTFLSIFPVSCQSRL
jgi:hypothetical protein